MKTTLAADITECKESDNWTRVTFKPDLKKFSMSHLEDDDVALMKKHVVDVAACIGSSVKVELNGKQVIVKSFQDYIDLCLKSAKNKEERFVEKVNEWDICVTRSEGQFEQVSFVNGIATIKGGTHVDFVTNQLTSHIITAAKNKNENVNLKAHDVKRHLCVFVNARIVNPSFSSQTKETLTIQESNFGSSCKLPKTFLEKVVNKSGIVEALVSWEEFEQKDLKKTDGTNKVYFGIPKLEDANLAGGSRSHECSLILTEGDSAKGFAMAGLSVVGRDLFGVFPLSGKLLNVREVSQKKITENAEIQNIIKILGLEHGKVYDEENVKSLRYGNLVLMTDPDPDGSHIKGLLINFIHLLWPSLLKVPGFMVSFVSPIIKATSDTQVLLFFTITEFNKWKNDLGVEFRFWVIKYYKLYQGLGANNRAEAVEYFSDIKKYLKKYEWGGDDDGDAIELAFSKKRIAERKNWLNEFVPRTLVDNRKINTYRDFISDELILYSMANIQRSIPSMIDGLKTAQRKILFCCFKRNLTEEIRVAVFAGYVSHNSAYHHGNKSLESTIIGMAQDFVGSKNINLLSPQGQFGTRYQGGKDCADGRYLYTKLSSITRYLFPKGDDLLLDYLYENGQRVQPSWFVPVIPAALVNGCHGIATGWSTNVPNFNPRDIIANIRRLLKGHKMKAMHPWYKGFRGTISKDATKGAGAYTTSGLIEESGTTDGYSNKSDNSTVHFEVQMSEENMQIAKKNGLLKAFKLTTPITLSNMHLLGPTNTIKKYETPEQILEDFYLVRLDFYEKRKDVQLKYLEMEIEKLENMMKFVGGVVSGDIIINNTKADLVLDLKIYGLKPFPQKSGRTIVWAEVG